ncbi:MAG: hypothetical protein IT338_10065, partial [Thermomicrobiales bacterium]|nr:hypothetical protein [Thermomicrobiales bacterium]
MRPSSSRSPRRHRASWHGPQLLVILSLLVSLLAPLAPALPAAAQTGSQLPPPLPQPSRVALSGSFQTVLGCPADFDPTCPQTQLNDNRDGSWSAALPVPPGDYTFRVVASSDTDRSLGAGGDPNGADLTLSVPANAGGAYFRYDSLTGEITAEPVAATAVLQTDLGEQYAMAPTRGGYQVTWDAQPGTYGFQVLFDGQPVSQDSVSLDSPSRVIVAVDQTGAVTTKDTLRGTTLQVTATDAAGAPRPGSCFAILDRQNRLMAQACDADDGQADGVVNLRVPDGLDDGDYTLRETATAAGATPAPDQRIALGRGQFTAAAQAPGGEETPPAEAATASPAEETPTGEATEAAPPVIQQAGQEATEQPVVAPGQQPGQLIVESVDENQQPLPGACYALVEFGFELCDDDQNGTVVFDAVPSTPLTLRETAAPAGYEPVADIPITVDPSGMRLLVPQQPVSGQETPPATQAAPPIVGQETPQSQPTETPQQGAGQVLLTLQDRDGNPVTGACWALSERGGASLERCDADDGSDDGAILFDAVSPGRYRLDETRTPEGFQPAGRQTVDAAAGQTARLTVAYERAAAAPGRLVITVADAAGQRVPNTCFDLQGPANLNDVCDQENDGRLNLPDLPAGDYTVTQTRTADGFTPAPATTVTVPSGETIDLPLVNEREGTPQGQVSTPANEGALAVDIVDANGTPVANACISLDQGSERLSVCDNDTQDENGNPGAIDLTGLAPGDYTLTVVPPEGFTAPAATTARIVAGETATVDVTLTATPAQAGPGRLAMVAEDDSGGLLPGACYTVEAPPGGQAFGPFCDEDGDGMVQVQGVTPGQVAVVETTAPAGAEPADPARQTVDIVSGQETTVTFRHAAQAQQAAGGAIDVHIEDAAGNPVSACVDVTGGEQPVTVCDNQAEDSDPATGYVLIDAVAPGSYTVGLSSLPEGTIAPAQQQIAVEAGTTTQVDFALAAANGTMVLFVEDPSGQRLGGSCFTITSPTRRFADICDQGDDGRLNIPDLPPDTYDIVQTRSAPDREIAPPQTVTVDAGQTVEVTLVNPLIPTPTPTATATPTVTPTATPTVVPTATPTVIPTATPTVVPTATPTATATAAPTLTPTSTPTATATPAIAPAISPTPVATMEQPAGGTFTIVNLDPDGNLLGGGCFNVTNADGAVVAGRCDNDAGDFDNTLGVIAFGALPTDAYTVTQTSAPEGFTPAAPVQFDHGSGDQLIDITTPRAPTETGAVELQTVDENGNRIPGLCYTLSGRAGEFGPFCDGGEGDTSSEPGVLVVQGLPAGTYEAVLQSNPEQPGATLEQQARPRRSVSIRRGDRPTRAVFNVRRQQSQRGDLLVRVRDQDGTYLAGACFALIPEGETAPSAEVCDNRNGDGNSSAGRILFTGLRAGRYTLTQTTAPRGYTPAADQTVRVPAGDVREVAVTNHLVRQQPATLDVRTVDAQGNLLPGACYAAVKGVASTEACDIDSGSDGVTHFAELPAGAYVVRQTRPPSGGYALAGATTALLNAGQTTTVTIVNEARPGSLLLRKTDPTGQPLPNACFALLSGNRTLYAICDNDASDGNRNDGVILLGTVAPGRYTLRETRAPSGFLPAADQPIEITANQRLQVNVANRPAPPPQRTGNLRVSKVDSQGRALAGSCFALVDANGNIVHPTCDADDGADNGVILIEQVAIGDYTLRETRRPSADYEAASDVAVSVAENRTTDIEIENRLRAGRILIRKSDPNGNPLANACFDLVEDSAGAACTNEDGELLFANLPPRTYTVVETQAPSGFLMLSQIDPVTVRPGSTTTIDVVNQPAPPPPDSGSLQVVKFDCPALPGGGGIVFVDSSDPDGGGLARTAGCTLGDAAFSLDGPSGPLAFRTGTGGRFQRTLLAGDYVLTERATGAHEDLTVSVNTLTTVVVVNYVEPQGEEPATIDVIKYTCDPGFQGRIWADFANACASVQNLTNDVSFRLTGPVGVRRVTGDGGQGGVTRFTGLPSGSYRLQEEAPAGVVAIYAFCGLDANNPDGRSVGDTAALQLAAGQLVTCHWFDVPEDLTAGTGAITVYKYACPVTTAPTGYDWFNRCDPQGPGVRFSLSAWDGTKFVPATIGATDGDGILRLTRLQPGIYDLQEVDAAWCHAESDSVNGNGNVVVNAGARASVWIFDCLGPKNPPNTGAGPLWSGAGGPPSPLPATGVGAALLWPLAALAALRRR